MSILTEILAEKAQEITRASSRSELERNSDLEPRGFVGNFLEGQAPRVIAELKKASPSKGVICPEFLPEQIAKAYQSSGARALSVLTDEKFFQGKLEYLSLVRAAVPECVLLRKDFIIDPIQLAEAIAYGADAVLLIVAAMDGSQLQELYLEAIESGLDVLIEVHSEKETESALILDLNPERTLLGVNNRNLNTFQVSLETSVRISQEFKKEFENRTLKLISESGIKTREEIEELSLAGFSGFLVGESLVNEPEKLSELTSS